MQSSYNKDSQNCKVYVWKVVRKKDISQFSKLFMYNF